MPFQGVIKTASLESRYILGNPAKAPRQVVSRIEIIKTGTALKVFIKKFIDLADDVPLTGDVGKNLERCYLKAIKQMSDKEQRAILKNLFSHPESRSLLYRDYLRNNASHKIANIMYEEMWSRLCEGFEKVIKPKEILKIKYCEIYGKVYDPPVKSGVKIKKIDSVETLLSIIASDLIFPTDAETDKKKFIERRMRILEKAAADKNFQQLLNSDEARAKYNYLLKEIRDFFEKSYDCHKLKVGENCTIEKKKTAVDKFFASFKRLSTDLRSSAFLNDFFKHNELTIEPGLEIKDAVEYLFKSQKGIQKELNRLHSGESGEQARRSMRGTHKPDESLDVRATEAAHDAYRSATDPNRVMEGNGTEESRERRGGRKARPAEAKGRPRPLF